MADGANPLMEDSHAVPQSRVDGLLASLRDQGAARFDAAGWHYLDSLARRAAGHEGSVRRLLEEKLERAAGAFAERLARARGTLVEPVAAACEKHPQAAEELQRLFAGGDFKGLRYLLATLEAREQCAALAGLVSQFEPALAGAPEYASAHQAAPRATAAIAPTLELKTVRESRATWARLSVDKQLSMAMQQAPKNAGPINSHMLVLRSLAMMQDISPEYLSRVVSYLDTLLVLNPGEKVAQVKRTKSPSPRAAKPTKAPKKA